MTNKEQEVAGSTRLKEADERRRRAITYSLTAAAGAWVAAFAVYAVLKSMQPGGTMLDLVLLLWNAVMIAAPLAGYVVYRRMR